MMPHLGIAVLILALEKGRASINDQEINRTDRFDLRFDPWTDFRELVDAWQKMNVDLVDIEAHGISHC